MTVFQALQDLLAPRHRREAFVVVAMRVPCGVSPEGGFAVRDRLNEFDPDLWRFLNPGTFHAYFRASRSGSSRARACLDALEPLRVADPSLANFEGTLTEGTLIASIDGRGRVLDVLGGLVHENSPRRTGA